MKPIKFILNHLIILALMLAGDQVFAQRQELLPQQGHKKTSYAMAAHPNGRYLATVENDIRIWDLYSRKLLRVFKEYDDSHEYLSFPKNKNSKLLLTTGPQSSNAFLWDIEQGKLLKTFPLGNNFSPSSITWVDGADEEPRFFYVMGYKDWRKYDINKSEPIVSSTLKDNWVDATTDNTPDEDGLYDLDIFTESNRLMVLPEIDYLLLRFNDTIFLEPLNATLKQKKKKLVVGSHLYSVDYCSEKNLLAVATNNDFQIFDLNTDQRVFLKKNLWTSYAHEIRISDNGKYVFLDYSDSSAVVEWKTGKTMMKLTPTVKMAEFMHNDEYLVVGDWKSPFVFNIKTGSRQGMEVYESKIEDVKLLEDRYLQLNEKYNGKEHYFDLYHLQYIDKYVPDNPEFEAAWDNTFDLITVTRGLDTIKQFKISFKINGVPLNQVPVKNEKVSDIVISPDGKYVYTVEIIHDPRNTKKQLRQNKKSGLISYSMNKFRRRISMYEVATGKRLASSQTLKEYIAYKLKLSQNGQYVMARGSEAALLLDARNLKELEDFSPEQPDNWIYFIRDFIMVPSQKVFIVCQEWKLHLWSTETMKKIGTVPVDMRYFESVNVFQDSILVLGGSGGKNDLMLFHIPSQKVINWAKTTDQGVKSIDLLEDHLLINYTDGSFKLWSILNWEGIVQCIFDIENKEFVIYREDGVYYGTKDILKYLTLTQGLKSYSISQFDHRFNKPHEILKSLGFVDPNKAKLMEKLYEKRLQQYKSLSKVEIDQSPEIEIGRPDFETYNPSQDIRITGRARSGNLSRLEVWVNGVPLYGRRGLKLQAKQTIDTTIRIRLTKGKNELIFSLRDENNLQSSKEKRLINNWWKDDKDSLFVICVATSKYKDDDYNLRYAVKDGRDIIKTMKAKNRYGKPVGFSYIVTKKYHLKIDTLFDEDVNRNNFAALANRIKNCRPQDKIIFSMSGHGMLDENLNWWFATHDMDFDKPQQNGISYEMIMDLLEQSPSRHKLLLLDACHSGELDRSNSATNETVELVDGSSLVKQQFKGARVTTTKKVGLDNSYELMKEYFLDMHELTGVHVISAASGDSYALEGEQWQNGVFSYCFMQAIGDLTNHSFEGSFSIAQLKEYMTREVVRLTNEKQKPMTRGGNPQFDFQLWEKY